MVKLLIQWTINAAILLATTMILPGFTIDSWPAAFLVAFVMGVLNVIVRPILVLVTLPITVITLGLFMLVINGGLLLLASTFIEGFEIDSLWTAILASVVISLLSLVVSLFFNPKDTSSK